MTQPGGPLDAPHGAVDRICESSVGDARNLDCESGVERKHAGTNRHLCWLRHQTILKWNLCHHRYAAGSNRGPYKSQSCQDNHLVGQNMLYRAVGLLLIRLVFAGNPKRMVCSVQGRQLVCLHIKNNQRIQSLVHPATWYEEGSLWTCVPGTSERNSIDPGDAFVDWGRVEKSILCR